MRRSYMTCPVAWTSKFPWRPVGELSYCEDRDKTVAPGWDVTYFLGLTISRDLAWPGTKNLASQVCLEQGFLTWGRG